MENAVSDAEQHQPGIPATGPDSNFSQELSRGVPLGGGFGGLRMPQPALLNPAPLNPAPVAHATNPSVAQASVPVSSQQAVPQTMQASSSQDFYPTTTVPTEFLQQLAVQKAATPEATQETYPSTTVPDGWIQQQAAPQQTLATTDHSINPETILPDGWIQQQTPTTTAQSVQSETAVPEGWAAPQQSPAAAVQTIDPPSTASEEAPKQYSAPQPMPTAPIQAAYPQTTAPEGFTQTYYAPQPLPTTPDQTTNPNPASSEAQLHQAVAQPQTANTPGTAPEGFIQQQVDSQQKPAEAVQAVNPAMSVPETQTGQVENPASKAVTTSLSDIAAAPQNTSTEKLVEAAKSTTETTVPFTKTAIPKPQPKRIGDILIDEGYITSQQLAQALQEGKATNSPLGAVLIRMGYIDEVHLGKALAKLHGLQYIDTSNLEIDPEVMKLVPSDFIRRHMVVPYRMDHAHKRIEVIMARPDNLHILDEVALLTGYRPIPRVSTHKELVSLLDKYYRSRSSADDAMARIEEDFSKQNNQYDQGGITKELEAEMDADDAPVVQLVNSILVGALDSNASDIHIEPQKERLLIRFRIDGILREMHSIPKKMGAAFVSRVKVASGMDIAERRRPQDGRMRLKEGSQEVDMRVNTLATQFGEKIVIRLLRPNATTGGIEKLGLRSDEGKRIAKMVHAPHGIILVTGPTGSGKTTTLYSCLREINSPERNITTIEDPVEYPLSGVNQTQVSHKAGLTFSLCLRAILRQDPDVVMVGEIRDHETLEAAIHASLTGHLVFSTLHTNSASKTITRLLEMGAPNYLVSTAVIGILAQRLVRKVCNACRVSYTSTEEEMGILNITEPVTLQKGEGCDKCGKSGYSGRVGLYEIMTMNREVQELVTNGASTFQIQDAAVRNGMLTLGMDGKRKIYEGLTTVAEVTRVLGLDLDEG